MFCPLTEYSNRHPRHPCLNEIVWGTILFFVASAVSFLVLLLFISILWACIFLVFCTVLSAFYIDWLRRAPQGPLLVQTLPHDCVPVEAGLGASTIAALPSYRYQRYCDCNNNGCNVTVSTMNLMAMDGINDESDGNGWLQCAICIGMLQIGEMVRSIPACKHLFHVECVDMWLKSHSTCPLCRGSVAPTDATSNLVAEV